ncbi:MAG TPA: hypothetical protein VL400_23415 [Polyangiaceae bacterium]|nr:hypothetical protein [Polyangiaceae bacterium]
MLPVFVDEDGTRCAMAHLIEPTAPDLVQHIAGARNFERVRTLADIPELARWLEDNGLTLEEAMAIQPSYCGDQTECVCSVAPATDVFEGDVAAGTNQLVVSKVWAGSHHPGDTFQGAEQIAGFHVMAIASGESYGVVGYGREDGRFDTPGCQTAGDAGPVTPEVLAFAVSSESCSNVLVVSDPRWDHPGGTCDDAEGCSSGGVAGAGHASLVAGLIAGAGALTALRRLRRR